MLRGLHNLSFTSRKDNTIGQQFMKTMGVEKVAQTRLAISFPVALCIGMGLGENRIFRILNVLELILLSGKVTGVTG